MYGTCSVGRRIPSTLKHEECSHWILLVSNGWKIWWTLSGSILRHKLSAECRLEDSKLKFCLKGEQSYLLQGKTVRNNGKSAYNKCLRLEAFNKEKLSVVDWTIQWNRYYIVIFTNLSFQHIFVSTLFSHQSKMLTAFAHLLLRFWKHRSW